MCSGDGGGLMRWRVGAVGVVGEVGAAGRGSRCVQSYFSLALRVGFVCNGRDECCAGFSGCSLFVGFVFAG